MLHSPPIAPLWGPQALQSRGLGQSIPSLGEGGVRAGGLDVSGSQTRRGLRKGKLRQHEMLWMHQSTAQAGEEAAPSARDRAAHPGASSWLHKAQRGDRGRSGESQGLLGKGPRAGYRDGKCRGNHCTVLPRLRALQASPMYRAGCWGHGPWLHGDSPLEPGAAMSGAPTAPITPRPSSETKAPSLGKLRTSA